MSDTATVIAKARQGIEAALIEKASTDPDFRALLIAEPHAALKNLLGGGPAAFIWIPCYRGSPG